MRAAVILLLGVLGSCGIGPPTSHQLDQQIMNAETSPIPGATAKVLAAAPGADNAGPVANFCVTDAGYCPLAAAVPAGRNCLCAAGGMMYGGKTGATPQAYLPLGGELKN